LEAYCRKTIAGSFGNVDISAWVSARVATARPLDSGCYAVVDSASRKSVGRNRFVSRFIDPLSEPMEFHHR